MARFLHRLGSATARHPWRTIGVWAIVAIAVLGINRAAGGGYDNSVRIPGAESQAATDRMVADFPASSGSQNQVVYHASAGTLADSASSAAIKASVTAMKALPHVANVNPPGKGSGASSVSADGTIGFATVGYDVASSELGRTDLDALRLANEPAVDAGLQVEYGGDLVRTVEKPTTGNADKIGLAVAAVVLVIAFASVIAAGLPIGVAVFALVVGLSLVGVLSAVTTVPSTTTTLGTMIGLGVGIDYSLFVVTRQRENLAGGASVDAAAGNAIATSGQSVLFAGTTVVIAISGLAIAGIPFVTSLGFATSIVVAVTMLAAVTLLPGLLGLAGRRIGTGRRQEHTGDAADHPSVWGRWAHHVGSHPWPYTLASVALLLLLAVPTLSMRLGQTDAGTLAPSSTQRRAYDLIARGLGPGYNGPLRIELDGAGAAGVTTSLSAAVAREPGVAAVTPAQTSPSGMTEVFNVIPATSPENSATTTLTHRIRSTLIPNATAGTAVHVRVTGSTAGNVDLADRIGSRLQWFLAAVIALSFVLLMMVFRSVLVPFKAALCNLLSVGAGYGVVVAVFQWGWMKGLIGLHQTVPIVAWVPMMMFAILFGLSMDYEVFLISRIREDWLRSGDSHASVVNGVASTASVITSAAVIMVSVFASFILVDDPVIKMLGLGLAVAVLVDATVIRMITVPATMELLGDGNWWLPNWLDRILPTLDLEGTHQASTGDDSDETGARAAATGNELR
jgi:RND superfamily putative drug exporter